jgi:hypothetical protein
MDQAEVIGRVQALSAWLESWIGHLREVGRSCALGGDARWNETLAALDVAPLSDEERARHVAEGPLAARKNSVNPRGDLPNEMR